MTRPHVLDPRTQDIVYAVPRRSTAGAPDKPGASSRTSAGHGGVAHASEEGLGPGVLGPADELIQCALLDHRVRHPGIPDVDVVDGTVALSAQAQ